MVFLEEVLSADTCSAVTHPVPVSARASWQTGIIQPSSTATLHPVLEEAGTALTHACLTLRMCILTGIRLTARFTQV